MRSGGTGYCERPPEGDVQDADAEQAADEGRDPGNGGKIDMDLSNKDEITCMQFDCSQAESVAALHEKEVVQTGVVGTLGRRSAFSLHCVLQETALVQEALKALPSIMLAFTYEQNQGHSMISRVWESIIAREADKMN